MGLALTNVSTAIVLPFIAPAKQKISFDIYQTTVGGMVSIDAVVPERLAQSFIALLRAELLL